MGVTRRFVFPIIRIVIWAVIAAALVKIAFTGAELDPGDAEQPTGSVVESTVQVGTGTVTNAVTVAGLVATDRPVVARATLAGTVSALHAADGAVVAAGDPLLDIRQEAPRDPLVRTDPETGEQTVTERRPTVTVVTIEAPAAGTLAMTILKDETVSVGDTVASVQPASLHVTGTLTPEQQYRLLGAPTEAEVTLRGGPAPFACTDLRVGAAAAPVDPLEPAVTGVVTCSVPEGVTAFAGLGAEISIVNGTAQDAVVVPVTAVQGSVELGNVWVVGTDGEATERQVVLGLTDGEVVQVVEGLAVDEEVLQFIPVPGGGGAVDCSDPASYDPMVCGG